MNKSSRQHYLDWLRIIAFSLLFLYHILRIFDGREWHIDNPEPSWLAAYFNAFTHTWRMPLVFLVSGAGTFYAMRSRKDSFFKDRVQRLIVPAVFMTVFLTIPQMYFDYLWHGLFHGSFFEFAKYYPAKVLPNLIWTNPSVFQVGYHAWFLMYLFMVTMCLLPLFILLNKNETLRAIIDRFSNTPFFLFIGLVGLITVDILLRPIFQGYLSWADFTNYSFFVLLGYLLQLNKHFIIQIDRLTWPALLAGLGTWIYMSYHPEMLHPKSDTYTLAFIIDSAVFDLNTYSWVIAFVGLAKKFLEFNKSWLTDLNKSVLPIYIIHQPVIIILAFYVVPWSVPMIIKFAVIVIGSVSITVGLYLLLRRNKIMRFLLGMRDTTSSEQVLSGTITPTR